MDDDADSLDFFISHAGTDRDWAEWVAWQLDQAGHSVELAVWDWAVGENVVARMAAALKRAARVVALLSPAYFEQGRFTQDEWTGVLAVKDARYQGRLIPFRIEPLPREAIPDPLRSLVHKDLFGMTEDEARCVLLAAVAGPRRPDGAPRFPGWGTRGEEAVPGGTAPAGPAPGPGGAPVPGQAGGSVPAAGSVPGRP